MDQSLLLPRLEECIKGTRGSMGNYSWMIAHIIGVALVLILLGRKWYTSCK